ncbi:unnamed protein product [Urochloa decumbens]|uniref:Uncharacterized protein n=1 Tax=Urochloa decumbens TaxID=240449 RepID=A0ABC9FZ15_9POAL
MVRRPPAGVIPVGHPSLAGVWLTRQIRFEPFRHMRNLIAALHAVAPAVLEDPQFLDRSVLVDGITPSTSPRDLSESFGLLDVERAVLVHDGQTGFRVRLVVFFDVADSAIAMRLAPSSGFYATCVPATSHGDPERYILDASANQDSRRLTAQIFRSLIPSQYLLDDEATELHMRCVFVRAVAGSPGTYPAGGAYGLCCVARDTLLARGYLSAVITCCDRGAGVLVYDDSETTELLSRRAPRLLYQFGLQMYESSVFPFLARPGDRDAPLMMRQLPPYISEDHYRCRVLLMTGLGTQHRDAAEVAYAVQHRLDLIYEGHEVEAVIIHRSEGVAVVVLGSSEDMEVMLQEPPTTWVLAFGQEVGLVNLFGCPRPSQASVTDTSPHQLSPRGCYSADLLDYARELFTSELKRCSDNDIRQIVSCLIGLCALAQPDAVWRRDFSDRALLLSGIDLDTSCSDLLSALSSYGVLEDNMVFCSERRMALAVFSSWIGASRLLLEPLESWARMGFDDCQRAPGAEDAGIIANEVHLTLSIIQGLGPDFL